MTTTAVPTIRDTIVNTLSAHGFGAYASHPVVDALTSALGDRETTQAQATPRVGTVASAVSANNSPGDVDRDLDARVTQLEEDIASLVQFAHDNGYRS